MMGSVPSLDPAAASSGKNCWHLVEEQAASGGQQGSICLLSLSFPTWHLQMEMGPRLWEEEPVQSAFK